MDCLRSACAGCGSFVVANATGDEQAVFVLQYLFTLVGFVALFCWVGHDRRPGPGPGKWDTTRYVYF
jgi:hypothetical protein